MSGLVLYWTGCYAEAIAHAQAAIEMARAVNDTSNMIRALSDLKLAEVCLEHGHTFRTSAPTPVLSRTTSA